MSKKEQLYEQLCIARTNGSMCIRNGAYHADISPRHMRRIYTTYSQHGAAHYLYNHFILSILQLLYL